MEYEIIQEHECTGRIEEVIDVLTQILETYGNVFVEDMEGSTIMIDVVEQHVAGEASNERIVKIR